MPTLFSNHRPEDRAQGLVVVVDARNQPPQRDLVSALQATQVSAAQSSSALPVRPPGTLTCLEHGAGSGWNQGLVVATNNPVPMGFKSKGLHCSCNWTIQESDPASGRSPHEGSNTVTRPSLLSVSGPVLLGRCHSLTAPHGWHRGSQQLSVHVSSHLHPAEKSERSFSQRSQQKFLGVCLSDSDVQPLKDPRAREPHRCGCRSLGYKTSSQSGEEGGDSQLPLGGRVGGGWTRARLVV